MTGDPHVGQQVRYERLLAKGSTLVAATIIAIRKDGVVVEFTDIPPNQGVTKRLVTQYQKLYPKE